MLIKLNGNNSADKPAYSYALNDYIKQDIYSLID